MAMLAVGFVRGAHGTGGEVKVGAYSGETGHLADLTEVELRCPGGGEQGRRLRVERVRLTHREALFKLEGIDDRETAVSLRRCELWVPREKASSRGEDEFYIADLVGCELYLQEGLQDPPQGKAQRPVGRVLSVWETGACDMLEVETAEGSVRNIPFREPYVGEVDTRRRRIALQTPWILE
ncbi:MAG: ribosome maturation factor RimM [Spirochaetaceae bacterium]